MKILKISLKLLVVITIGAAMAPFFVMGFAASIVVGGVKLGIDAAVGLGERL